MLVSSIYEGWLRHRRLQPVVNHFTYPLFMVYLDLSELPTLFDGTWLWSSNRWAPAWFRRADYLGDANVPLGRAVRERVAEETGDPPRGPIRLLTHLRYFGYAFNPVTLYYCFDAADRRVETVIAEITNTPWGERHAYVLPAERSLHDAPLMRFCFDKAFHISPFMPMTHRYDWRIGQPNERLTVHMENWESSRRVFDATLSMERVEITNARLNGLLLRYPMMTGQVVARIYLQALRLWFKRCPFFSHPDRHATDAQSVENPA